MRLTELLDDHRIGHDEIQMDSFITALHGGTVYGCYKQAVQELYKRVRGLRSLYIERGKVEVAIEELDIAAAADKYAKKLLSRKNKLKLLKNHMALDEVNRNIQATEREYRHFFSQASAMKEQLGELTPEKRKTLDEEFWIHHIKSLAAMDFLTDNRCLKRGTLELLQTVKPEVRKMLYASISKPQVLLDWFTAYEYPSDYPLLDVDMSKLQKLICEEA